MVMAKYGRRGNWWRFTIHGSSPAREDRGIRGIQCRGALEIASQDPPLDRLPLQPGDDQPRAVAKTNPGVHVAHQHHGGGRAAR